MRFFCSNQLSTSKTAVYFGGSITAGALADSEATSWRGLLGTWLGAHFGQFNVTNVKSSYGGTGSWYGLIRLNSDVIVNNPDVVFIDFAVNDTADDGTGTRPNGFAPAAEAVIRNIRTAFPNAKIVIWIFTWPDNYSHLSNRTSRDKWINLAAYYGVDIYRWDQYLESLMGTGYTDVMVETYFGTDVPHTVHPSQLGHTAAFNLAKYKFANFDDGYGALPSRYFAESEDYEQTPIIRNGTDNDGETGIWSTSGNMRVSSSADSTITYTGTFCSFGLDYNNTASGVVAWSVDGGAYTNLTLDVKPVALWNGTRAVHTVVFKVVSGTASINKFMAI